MGGRLGGALLRAAENPAREFCQLRLFRITIGVEVHRSARKHGLGEADIRQAAEHYLVAYLLDEDWPPRLGFDTAGRLLETVVLLLDDDELVIHAMKARPPYLDLLP